MSFTDILTKASEMKTKSIKELEKNGGICLNCGDNPAQIGGINSFHCEECNKKTTELVGKLKNTSVFKV